MYITRRLKVIICVVSRQLFFAAIIFCNLASNTSVGAQTDSSALPSKDTQLQGRVELNNLPKTGISDTQSHYWSALGTESYIHGDMAKAEQDFEKALSFAESSKLPADHRALLIANLASVKREQRQYAESEKLFRKSLDVLSTASKFDQGIHDYIFKQYRGLYRLQGRTKEAEFLIDSVPPAPVLSISKTQPLGAPVKLSVSKYLNEGPNCFCGIKASPKLEAVNKAELSERLFNESKEAAPNVDREWYRIPKGLAGKWRPQGLINSGWYKLPEGFSTTSSKELDVVPGVMTPTGVQVDAVGDVWDFDHCSLNRWHSYGDTCLHFQEFAKVASRTDSNSICFLSAFSVFMIDAASKKAISVQRFQMLQSESVIDANSISFAVSTFEFDDAGKAISRTDFRGIKTRVADFQKDDRYRESFVKFLKVKGLNNLIPP
ncbi:MAG: tetratricopeptide repeat protein [Candidatus Obscuribacterales bacterium]|nr:tetratricopeptide repeat protein [Candidatus Obscuribacterales bacterium]